MVADFLKNPLILRVVMNVVLMISDVDVCFSFVFLAQLLDHGGIYIYGFAVILAGLGSYCLGIVYFGPRQKNKVVKLVKQMFATNPTEFYSLVTNKMVTLHSPTVPNTSTRNPKQFKDLADNSNADRIEFQTGMSLYGLAAMWNASEASNAKNCTELKHGVPLLRLARFGFFAEPSASDLGGILNANAMYTFTTGILQILFGSVLVFVEGNYTVLSFVPLAISLVSLMLSICNILFNFSEVLTEMSQETRVKNDILIKMSAQEQSKKQNLKGELDKNMQKLDSKFAGKTTGKDILDKEDESKRLNAEYTQQLDAINQQTTDLLEVELVAYRERLEAIKYIMKGKRKNKEGDQSEIARTKQRRETIDHKIKALEDEKLDEIANLEKGGVAKAIDDIHAKYDVDIDAYKKLRATL